LVFNRICNFSLAVYQQSGNGSSVLVVVLA